MEQQEIVHRYYILGANTLDKTLQVLTHLSMEGLVKLKDSRFPLEGEIQLYKLMSRSDPLTSAFLNEKVNLLKLKEHLEVQGLPFAFKETSEGTNVYFRVKDKELAKKALEQVIMDIKKEPKIILKKPNAMTFEEKIAYARTQTTFKGTIPLEKLEKGRGI